MSISTRGWEGWEELTTVAPPKECPTRLTPIVHSTRGAPEDVQLFQKAWSSAIADLRGPSTICTRPKGSTSGREKEVRCYVSTGMGAWKECARTAFRG